MSDEPRQPDQQSDESDVEGHVMRAGHERSHSPVEDVTERARLNEDDVPEVEGHVMRAGPERRSGPQRQR
jgi:hypothetical protein